MSGSKSISRLGIGSMTGECVARRGKVWLVGAGPGDPELLTLKAARVLAAADVVLIDDLVDRRVLAHAPHARVIPVGKRGGCRSTPQSFIVRKLIQLSRAGACVARVKGGDPFVFGRGGEELAALTAAGVECEVIGGLTAGLSAPAALGIAVTHRDHAHGVTLVTAHTRDGAGPNWEALAQSGMTLVIYMGMTRLGAIARSLMLGGMPGSTPSAAVQSATLPGQASVRAALVDLEAAARSAQLASPAIIVVGEVARYASSSVRALALRA